MKGRLRLATVAVALFAACSLSAMEDGDPGKDYRYALRLYEKGILSAAKTQFTLLSEKYPDNEDIAAYSALVSVRMKDKAYEQEAELFREGFPYSWALPLIDYYRAVNYFDSGSYVKCIETLGGISEKNLPRELRVGYAFRNAYSLFMEGYLEKSMILFNRLVMEGRKKLSGYYAPSYYAMGYMYYLKRNFDEAAMCFEKSVNDARFSSLSRYYLIECHYLKNDYEYVTRYGAEEIDNLGGDFRKRLARMISESYMAMGNTEGAKEYYDRYFESSERFDRSDYFYAGMVAYGVRRYSDAISDFDKVTVKDDSLSQVAGYYKGYSYIQTGNKIAAMSSFKDASMKSYDVAVKEDAMFNYAKLAFDVNRDISGFKMYLEYFPYSERVDEIYYYVASAYMLNQDYASAVEAYRKIENMDASTEDSFRGALFMRSMQLAASGSYSQTIPLLKQIVRIKDGDRTAFLADYWLAEAYYRNDSFSEALKIFTSLKKKTSFASLPEYRMLDFNIGYSYFSMQDYVSAAESFKSFLASSPSSGKREGYLRLADSRFMTQNYLEAAETYEKCADTYYDRGDIYPLYQGAVAYGLVSMEAKKIALLERAAGYSRSVKYYDEAMYELGRSYVKIDEDVKAEKVFIRIAESSADSTLIAGSLIELGTIYRNRLDYDNALKFYKTVVEKMPMSVLSQDALAAIESIYQSKNDPQAYLDYIESIGKSSLKTEDERDRMIFSAAEQIFLKEDYTAALSALADYLAKYPDGSQKSLAYFYIAESNKALGRYEKALDSYYQVMKIGEGAFAESATLNYAELSFRLERYQQAYEGYATLGEISRLDANKYVSLVGVMRSKYALKEYENTINAAGKVIESPSCDENMARQARYIMAKSYIALSDRDSATPILKELSSQPQTDEGAEASYLLIQEVYDSGRFDEVEALVYDFAAKAQNQTYFLAKAFIVLGDSFAERDEWEQAKATFNSIKDNYKAPEGGDDIAGQIEMRLSRLEEAGI